MTRMKALWSASPRKVMAGLLTLMAAAGIAVGSGADFNSASANPSNTFSGGTMTQSNSKANAAILTASGMKPGDSATGTVDITNTGSLAGAFTLTKSTPVDTPTASNFSSKLTGVIEDLGDPGCVTSCPAATTVYNGDLKSMGAISLGTFAASAKHRYKFTVTFPDGGASGGDNAYQGASTSVDYTFTAAS
jgi:spore coat-associated protein N